MAKRRRPRAKAPAPSVWTWVATLNQPEGSVQILVAGEASDLPEHSYRVDCLACGDTHYVARLQHVAACPWCGQRMTLTWDVEMRGDAPALWRLAYVRYVV